MLNKGCSMRIVNSAYKGGNSVSKGLLDVNSAQQGVLIVLIKGTRGDNSAQQGVLIVLNRECFNNAQQWMLTELNKEC